MPADAGVAPIRLPRPRTRPLRYTVSASLLLHLAAWLLLSASGRSFTEEKKTPVIDLALAEPAPATAASPTTRTPGKRDKRQATRSEAGSRSAIGRPTPPQAAPKTPVTTKAAAQAAPWAPAQAVATALAHEPAQASGHAAAPASGHAASPVSGPAVAPASGPALKRTEEGSPPPLSRRAECAQGKTDRSPAAAAGSAAARSTDYPNIGNAPKASSGQSSGTRLTPSAAGGSPGTPSAESLKKRYLGEHFAYIRDLILQHVAYPKAARRMGWSGRVLVTFVVAADGSVGSIRVLDKSGYQLLDRSAVDTVREAAPFPRPPIAVELTVPIVYHLE